MFVYSSDMVHQPVEELIMSDDEMEYSHESDEFLMQNLHMVNPSHLIQEIQLPIRPPNPFDTSNEELQKKIIDVNKLRERQRHI